MRAAVKDGRFVAPFIKRDYSILGSEDQAEWGIGVGGGRRSVFAPVFAGSIYRVSRQVISDRFRVVFRADIPEITGSILGGSIGGTGNGAGWDTAGVIDTLSAPAGTRWMQVYYSLSGEPQPGIRVERIG